MKGGMMKTKVLKIAKIVLVVAIVSFALTALTGCGIGHGHYRRGYDGQNYYRSGPGHQNNLSNAPEYGLGNRGSASMIGYGPGRSGNCAW